MPLKSFSPIPSLPEMETDIWTEAEPKLELRSLVLHPFQFTINQLIYKHIKQPTM